MHLNLLIFCVVLSQAIIGAFSSENIKSSDLLVRNKRVLNIVHANEDLAYPGEFSFVVNILLLDVPHCVGSILSTYTVITSASCASNTTSSYKVGIGSVDIYRGTLRNVVDKKLRFGNHPRSRASDGIALFTVSSPLITLRYTHIARLHAGPILPGLQATIPGWGCYYHLGVRGTPNARKLRSITVPIMPHRECVDIYRGFYDINDEDVCIYDPQNRCGHTDSGAPLIIDGEVAAVYLKRAENHRLRPSPEIFVVLQHAQYRQWITDNIVH